MKIRLAPTKYSTHAKFALPLYWQSPSLAYPSSTVDAKRKPAKHGVIKIQTSPAFAD